MAASGGAVGVAPTYYRYDGGYNPVTGSFGHGHPVWYHEGVPTVGYEYPAAYGIPYVPVHGPRVVYKPRRAKPGPVLK